VLYAKENFDLPFLTTKVSGMVIGSAIFEISGNSIILSLK
jgi:hypothetical protein